jgi:hypothetical protein
MHDTWLCKQGAIQAILQLASASARFECIMIHRFLASGMLKLHVDVPMPVVAEP